MNSYCDRQYDLRHRSMKSAYALENDFPKYFLYSFMPSAQARYSPSKML